MMWSQEAGSASGGDRRKNLENATNSMQKRTCFFGNRVLYSLSYLCRMVGTIQKRIKR